MIHAVIIDDEPKNVRVMKNMLNDFCPQVHLVGEANNSTQGKELIREKKPELVFLDIEMPYGNGFDLLNALMPIDFEVIFVTAFDKYTLQALKYSALDYLLKPVNIDELKTAVQNAEVRINKNSINQQLTILLENFKKQDSSLKKIAIPAADGFDFILIEDIVRCEAQGPYTRIFVKDSKKLLVSKSLKEYESLLPGDIFLRVHNSHLVNLNYIKKYNRGRGGYIEMDDGTILEVATRRKDEFLNRFGY
ncbi:MAG TPA: LytTR family DNA-binding domain-containing protein [Chitinophagaceae bacterium]|nr:LytTR family DNA-binding domain-containing protein [Chitinophagaceae bacterium]